MSGIHASGPASKSQATLLSIVALATPAVGQDTEAPDIRDPKHVLNQVQAQVRDEAADCCYRVEWTRVHLRRPQAEFAEALATLEAAIEGTPDQQTIAATVQAYAEQVAADAKPATDPRAPPNTIESGVTDFAKKGNVVVAIDRLADGTPCRAVATDGRQTFTWNAEGKQLSFFADRQFAIQTDIDRLWTPLSTDESRQRTLANLPWAIRPLENAPDGWQLLRSSRPGRTYEFVLDTRTRPVRARVIDGKDSDAPPTTHTLYVYPDPGDTATAGGSRLAGSLRIGRRRNRTTVDFATILDRSATPPPQNRLEVPIPEDTKLFEFGSDRQSRQLRVDKSESWPAFLQERLRIQR